MIRTQSLFTILLVAIFHGLLCGQGIRGLVTDENSEPLPHVSIYVKEKGTGTSSNSEGEYELRLPPGTYKITFQFIGYEADEREVEIDDGFLTLNLSLKPRGEVLKEVEVTGSAEDPAYTIMRKAIAKAPYHLMQLDGYSAEVYMKGSGGLEKIPGLFRNLAAKDGVDTSRVFTSESISEVSFERPNTFKERVISVRTSGEDLGGANPNAYVNTSFYLPMVVEAVSPFSPRAMAYYRFKYVRNFKDRGFKIHEIEVKPRSAGDKVFSGRVFIRDEFWNIHSLDLQTKVEIFDVHLTQFFAPVMDEIWMPVTQKYEFSGSMLGFAGNYHYLASVSNYELSKNEDLTENLILVDEKIEEPPQEEVNTIRKKDSVTTGNNGEEEKELSRKQFRKLLKEYEKEDQEERQTDEDIISDRSFEIDSTAAKKDSAFWAERRPVPLTAKEQAGYQIDDSVYVATKKDSLSKPYEMKFELSDVLFGGRAMVSERTLFSTPGLLPRFRFNTVEGFNLDANAKFEIFADTNLRYELEPTVRYGFASEVWYGSLAAARKSGTREQPTTWKLEGGRFIRQFHPDAIHPFINSLYSLFLEGNYMKLYEQDYIEMTYQRDFRYRFFVTASAEWASRSTLNNHSNYSFFDLEGEEYSSNAPANIEDPQADFKNNQALSTAVELRWKPWQKYRKYNGELMPVSETSPEFRLTYNAGWQGLLGSEVDYQQIELGLKTTFDLGVRAKIDFDITGGSFLRNKNMIFADYKHFNGGLTELAPLSVTGNFRALDYYLYSTDDSYFSALSHVRFRKLLLTHIPIVRLTGIKESVFVNYLKTSHSPHYSEIGYSIDNIFRLFRLEFVQSFTGTTPESFGVRIGVGSLISINP